MKQLTLTIAFFLFGNFLTAQDCPPGDVYFDTGADIFQFLMPTKS